MLQHESELTSKQLANAMNVSVRTIKTYIANINKDARTKVIISNNTGYVINHTLAQSYLSDVRNEIPQDFKDRFRFICREFLLKHSDSLNIDDLCEKLFVSESTLRSDVKRINQLNSAYQIRMEFYKEYLLLRGPERELRKMFNITVFDDIGGNYFDYQLIQDEFPDFDPRHMVRAIRQTFAKNNYYINEFALFNLVLHISIIIERLKKGCFIEQRNTLHMPAEEKYIILDLCEIIEDIYNVKFNIEEITEMYILFRANANTLNPDDRETLITLVGQEISEDTIALVEDVQNNYYIDLSSNAFLIPFAMHLKNLIFRVQNDKGVFNPMATMIRSTQPIVFDIALFIARQLSSKYKIIIDESEVAFMALHIGGEIERQKQTANRIQTVLLCPNYRNISTQLYNNLLLSFSNDINIIASISNSDELQKMKIDMLITTVNMPAVKEYEQVLISPFLSPADKVKVQESIEIVRNNLINRTLKKHFFDYFREDLFYICTQEITNSTTAIEFLAKNLFEMGYVDESFAAKVMEREKAASTAFNDVAIPHSIEMDSAKTSVSVLICKDGLPWGGQIVHIVLLMSISKTNHAEFSRLYEALVTLFSNTENVRNFSKCTDFKSFHNLIMSFIK